MGLRVVSRNSGSTGQGWGRHTLDGGGGDGGFETATDLVCHASKVGRSVFSKGS